MQFLRYLFLFAIMLFLTSCGNDTASESRGAVTFDLEWKNASKEPLYAVATGADVCVDFGIETISAKIYDDINQRVSAQTWSWPCADHQGTLTDVPPGQFRIELEGMRNSSVAWRGSQPAIIEAGKSVDVGTVSMSYVGSDTTKPSVTGVVPASDALNVPPSSSISVTFSEPMAASSINSTSIYLKSGTTTVPTSASYSAATKTATITPASALLPATSYTLVVTFLPTDMAGNYLPVNNVTQDGFIYSSYSFMTASSPSATWKTTFIDSALDLPVSLALDKYNGVHVSYTKSPTATTKLGYATNWTGSWITREFTAENNGGSVIAVDRYDRVHIVYDDFSLSSKFSLKQVHENNGSWSSAAIDNATVGYHYDAISDSLDNLQVSYVKGGAAYYVSYSGTILTTTPLPTAKGSEISMALSSGNIVHIIVAGSNYGASNALYHLTNTSGSWVAETIATGGAYAKNAIVTDRLGYLHICYIDSGKLKYATNASGGWVSSQLTSADVFSISLAIDSSDKLHLSYFDQTQSNLQYAVKNGAGWAFSLVDSSGNGGRYNAIGVDSAGKVHIAYTDMISGKLKYATNK